MLCFIAYSVFVTLLSLLLPLTHGKPPPDMIEELSYDRASPQKSVTQKEEAKVTS